LRELPRCRCGGHRGRAADRQPRARIRDVRRSQRSRLGARFRRADAAFDNGTLPDADLARILDALSAIPKPTTGGELYVRFCRNCHGADAHGGRVGESITGESDELHEAVREGHGGDRYADRTEYMPAWTTAELSDVEVALVADYLATLPPGPDNDDDD
jgi:mono/diheme cytochrome c family protein